MVEKISPRAGIELGPLDQWVKRFNPLSYRGSLILGLNFIYFVYQHTLATYIYRHTRGYQKVLSLRHFPHSDSTMLHT